MSTSSLPASSKPTSVESLDDLLALSPRHLPGVDIAQMNLLCAEGLPGAAGLNIDKCLATLDEWATWVGHETDRHLYRFRCAPADYGHSEGYFRMLMLVTVLQQDFRVRYNPDRIGGIDFRDSRDLFIHGLLEGPHTGTCASMPVLYAAAGRRLGYPLRLVLTHGHVFVRWEGPDGRDRFNVECASRGMLSFPDEYYKTWPTPLTDEQVTKGRYLISLGAAEELAVFMESRGHCLLDNGRPREARMAYEHACRLDPLSPGHWSWLDDARVREASLVPHGDSLKTFSKWGCSMTISCLPTANSTLSAEPVRTFRLDSTRYRNYHPTLGRWVERDPIAYRDGVSLYEYVGSEPSCRLDPDGLAQVVITVLTGWYKESRLTVPGQTRYGCSVTGKCVCVEKEGSPKIWNMQDTKAECQIAITMNPDRFNTAKDQAGNPVTPQGVFGHEQMHAKKTQQGLEALRPQITEILQKAEQIAFQSENLCVQYLNNMRRTIQEALTKAAKNAGEHADPAAGRLETEGWPVDKKQYPPDPGTYSPTEVAPRLPWQGDPTVSGNPVYVL